MPNNTPPSKDLIRSLGILGWAELEPTIIASLALEYPLLLIGPHGTAKSLLLERLAEALNLNFRHYNASTLNFDDLVGFPVPDGDRVRYLRTPLDAWNAEAIFIDEISRCRIDMQNRLFPLVHECRLQGQKLTQLRYRWAAMNPPPTGEEDVHHQYIGTEALDPAFADRFPWIIHVPTDLRGTDLIALIRGPKCDPDAGERLISEVQKVRSRLKTTEEIFGEKVAAYIQYLFPLLKKYQLPISNRRTRYLYHNILALIATQRYENLKDPAMIALQNSLPHRCWQKVSEVQIVKICRSAERCLEEGISKIERSILIESCHLMRAKITIEQNQKNLFLPIVLDGLNSLPTGKRYVFSHVIFHVLARYRSKFPALGFEMLAENISYLESLEPEDIELIEGSHHHIYTQMVLETARDIPKEKMWLRKILYLCARDKAPIEELLDYAAYAVQIGEELEKSLQQSQ